MTLKGKLSILLIFLFVSLFTNALLVLGYGPDCLDDTDCAANSLCLPGPSGDPINGKVCKQVTVNFPCVIYSVPDGAPGDPIYEGDTVTGIAGIDGTDDGEPNKLFHWLTYGGNPASSTIRFYSGIYPKAGTYPVLVYGKDFASRCTVTVNPKPASTASGIGCERAIDCTNPNRPSTYDNKLFSCEPGTTLTCKVVSPPSSFNEPFDGKGACPAPEQNAVKGLSKCYTGNDPALNYACAAILYDGSATKEVVDPLITSADYKCAPGYACQEDANGAKCVEPQFSQVAEPKVSLTSKVLDFFKNLLGASDSSTQQPATTCAAGEDALFALTATTDSHVTTDVADTQYPVKFCWQKITTANPYTCTATNTILKLSGATDAHAAIATDTTYTQNVCYGNIQCTTKTSDCAASDGTCIARLSDVTNAHVSLGCADTNFPVRLCCKTQTTPLVCITGQTQTCTTTANCPGTQTCSSTNTWGSCRSTTPGGICPIQDRCAGVSCTAPQTCDPTDGVCKAPPPAACTSNAQCTAPQTCQSGVCAVVTGTVDVGGTCDLTQSTDPAKTCTSNLVCTNNVCTLPTPTCTLGQTPQACTTKAFAIGQQRCPGTRTCVATPPQLQSSLGPTFWGTCIDTPGDACPLPAQTCLQQNGDICTPTETCSGTILTSTDTTSCCSVTCQTQNRCAGVSCTAPQTCDPTDGQCKTPSDSDGDGVPDRSDRCPRTSVGASVDDNGCSPQQLERQPGAWSPDSCVRRGGVVCDIGATCTNGNEQGTDIINCCKASTEGPACQKSEYVPALGEALSIDHGACIDPDHDGKGISTVNIQRSGGSITIVDIQQSGLEPKDLIPECTTVSCTCQDKGTGTTAFIQCNVACTKLPSQGETRTTVPYYTLGSALFSIALITIFSIYRRKRKL